ncbi:MAG: YdcF family protein, partial [Acidobacteriota bacterium]|nr:YdcF family protein [Acidobacteriota bacterium]
DRCVYAAELYRRLGGVPVFTSGGGGAEVPDGSYAAAMRRALMEEGIPGGAVATEVRSRSTRENAFYSAQLLRERGVKSIVLVTSAYHMSRAAACFRKQGFEVTPAACDFRFSSPLCWQDWLPSASSVEINDALLHEWIGFVVYRWKGWV